MITFICSHLSASNACAIIMLVIQRARLRPRVFLWIMKFLLEKNLFRLPLPTARINSRSVFATSLGDPTAVTRYRFTIQQLQELSSSVMSLEHMQGMSCLTLKARHCASPHVRAIQALYRRGRIWVRYRRLLPNLPVHDRASTQGASRLHGKPNCVHVRHRQNGGSS